LQIKLISEKSSGCKRGQEWAAHEEAEISRSWGKSLLVLVPLSHHGPFASGAEDMAKITWTGENCSR